MLVYADCKGFSAITSIARAQQVADTIADTIAI